MLFQEFFLVISNLQSSLEFLRIHIRLAPLNMFWDIKYEVSPLQK